jgi:hypothetical protein
MGSSFTGILVDPQLVEDMNVDWHRIAPLAYSFSDTALEPDAISNQIRAFYFGSETIGNSTAQNLTRLYSDRWFNHGTRTSAVLHGKMNEAVPIFLYLFAYQGQQTHLKFLGINEKLGETSNGVCQRTCDSSINLYHLICFHLDLMIQRRVGRR